MKRLWIAYILCICLVTGCRHTDTKTTNTFHGQKADYNRFNVLLVGVDSRGEAQSRSDAIMIVQYTPQTQTVKLASIMRDSYVKIAGQPIPYNKINMAYYRGGAELLRQTIQDNFGIQTQHYAAIDFQGFPKIIDAIAPEGIEVDIKQTMIDDMGLKLQPGKQRLHGQDLLAYARFRHDAESDFGRVRRQQEVVHALQQTVSAKMSSAQGMLQLAHAGQAVLKHVETDMNTGTILKLVGSLMLHPAITLETMRIPIQDGYENHFYEHAGSVLELDVPKNETALQHFFLDKPVPVSK